MAHLKVLSRYALEHGRLILKTRRLDRANFYEAAYRTLLKRDPDNEGIEFYNRALERKSMNYLGVLLSLTGSQEFRMVQGLPLHPLYSLHESRIELIQEHLPKADVIVDLGGASTDHPEGALLGLGYPHRPSKVWILDLPPDIRMLKSAEKSKTYMTDEGTEVQYLYRSMTDLSGIQDESVELVFSGESIEHITEEEGDIVCQEAYRVLKPGGYFCLDTPNGRLTRLESPDAFIHPEHKKEYLVQELRDKLERWGFEVLEGKAICPMPESIRTGKFDHAEMARNQGLSDRPEEGYLFYLKARKPANAV